MNRRMQKTARRLHFALDAALAIILLTLAVLLSLRFDRTFTFRDREAPLSRRATSLLSRLDGPVRCIAVIPHDNAFYASVRKLLLDMKDAASGADVTMEFPDPHVDISRASFVTARHKAQGWCVIFERGDRAEVVPLDAMVERPRSDPDSLLPDGADAVRFNGEQQCVTAIARLARPKNPAIYALSGHGERDFSNYDPLSGFSDLAREIRREGYRIEPLVLSESPGIPADCDLLVVAGPVRPPLPGETEAIASWLSRGGRILLLMDRADRTPSGWEPLASRLGISFPGLTAISEGTLGGFNVSADTFPNHPVGRDLARSAVTMSSPQVIDLDQDNLDRHRLKADIVAAAPRRAWGESAPDSLPRGYDPGLDRRGILPLAIAISVNASDDLGVPLMRAFVVGDSTLGSNACLAGGAAGNRDLLLNAIDWLTDSGLPLAPSRSSRGASLQLNLSRKRQIRFWTISCALWPLSILVAGAFAATIRRILS